MDLVKWPRAPRGTKRPDYPNCQVSGEAKVEELLSLIELEPGRLTPPCKCCGEISLSFHREEELRATVSLHHDEKLRWHDGEWAGDAGLTAESRAKLAQWLRNNGVPFTRSEDGLLMPVVTESKEQSENEEGRGTAPAEP